MGKRISPRTIILALLSVLFLGAVAWIWYLTIFINGSSPTVDTLIGGAAKVTVTFDGTTIQATDQINQYNSNGQPDPNGPAIAERACGKRETAGPYLPWDILKLSLSGGPSA